MFLWQNAGLKNSKVLVMYIANYFQDILFQVDHVWTIRGPIFTNLKVKRGLKERQPCPEGYHHVSKVLVPYKISYFHEIRFQVDHVWTIRGPRFANLKDKREVKERQHNQRVTTIGAISVSASINHLSK